MPTNLHFKRGYMKNDDVTYKVIGHAMHVHSSLGPCHKEIIYRRGLERRFSEAGLSFASEHSVQLFMDNKSIGSIRVDFLVENDLIVEIKSVPFLNQAAYQQVRSYVNNTAATRALLINFGLASLQYHRVNKRLAKITESPDGLTPPEKNSLRESSNPPKSSNL